MLLSTSFLNTLSAFFLYGDIKIHTDIKQQIWCKFMVFCSKQFVFSFQIGGGKTQVFELKS
jgi:hypothetical protein